MHIVEESKIVMGFRKFTTAVTHEKIIQGRDHFIFQILSMV